MPDSFSEWRRTDMGSAVKLNSVDHIGIVVRDMEAAVESWSSLLGIGPWTKWEIPGSIKGANAARSGGVMFELIEPVSETAFHAEFLRTHGEGLHHICVLVDDVDAATKELEAEGGQIIFLNPGVASQVEIGGPGSISLELRREPA